MDLALIIIAGIYSKPTTSLKKISTKEFFLDLFIDSSEIYYVSSVFGKTADCALQSCYFTKMLIHRRDFSQIILFKRAKFCSIFRKESLVKPASSILQGYLALFQTRARKLEKDPL